MHKVHPITLCLCIIAGPVYAQIVIDWTEIPHEIGVEFTHNGAENVPVVIGPGGGPYEWYFMQPGGPQNVHSFVVPRAATPFGDSFPTADLVLEITDNGNTVYAYADLQPTWGINLGYGATGVETLCVRFSPVDSYPLPLVYGNSRSFHFGYVIQLAPLISLQTDQYGYEVIDAYGSTTIPFGAFTCLRICAFDTTVSTLLINNVPVSVDTTTHIIYDYMTEDYGLVAHVASQPEETDPNFTDASLLERLSSFSSAVAEQSSLAISGDIRSGGIFHHSVSLPITMGRPGRIQLSVYNSSGRRVWSDIRMLPEGSHVLVWNGCDDTGGHAPEGVYFYRINTATAVYAGKVILIR